MSVSLLHLWHKRLANSIVLGLISFLLLNSCSPTKKENVIRVFAAASLGEVLRELGEKFEQQKSIKLEFNFGSSGTLARQIAQGAKPDLYISANKSWADYLLEEHIFIEDKIEKIAQNRLVLIAPKNKFQEKFEIDTSLSLVNILGKERLSIGDPRHVPAGQYARQALIHFGLYKEAEPHILPGKDVRSALMVVEMEEAALGVVYRTDALRSKKVSILANFPQDSHEGIFYYAGLCNEGATVKDFMSFLVSDKARTIWQGYGFE
ncbi:MAG: molybdate ABC transporter substrate-binding protein [Bacteroidota bacterium]